MPGLSDALRELVDRIRYGETEKINVDPPAPRLKPMEALAFSPEQREYSRQNGGLWDSTPPGYVDTFVGETRPPAESWRDRSNEENIRAVNEQLAAQLVNAGPSAGLSDAALDAKVQEQLGPKDRWKTPAPTPEGMALYGDLLAAAKAARAPRALAGPVQVAQQAHAAAPPPGATKATRQADASPEEKTQAAPGGGAGGAAPMQAALQMALAQIPNPDVRALLAKRMQLATDGDTELRAAQAKEERLGAMAGLQRQMGMAAATLGGDRYDDTAAAGAERAAGIGTRGVMARRQGEDQHAQRAQELLGQMERERAGRAGEALKGRDLELEGQRLTETGRHNREGEKIDWMNARSARIKAEKDTAAGMGEGNPKFENMVQKFSKDVAPLSDLSDAMVTLDEALKEKDISGVGRVAGQLSRFGLGSDKALRNRQAIQTVGNVILRSRAGTAVSASEAQRVAIETGMSPSATDEQFRIGAKAAMDVLRRSGGNLKAKYPSAVSDVVRDRGGWVPENAPVPQAQPPSVSSQQEYNALPSGAEYIAPDGSRRRKR